MTSPTPSFATKSEEAARVLQELGFAGFPHTSTWLADLLTEAATMARESKSTLCWRCTFVYPIQMPHCPDCKAINANVNLEGAKAQAAIDSSTREKGEKKAGTSPAKTGAEESTPGSP